MQNCGHKWGKTARNFIQKCPQFSQNLSASKNYVIFWGDGGSLKDHIRSQGGGGC